MTIKAAAPADVALLTELIRRRSVTPTDAGCQALLAERLERLGFRCEEMPFGEVKNLWARRGTDSPLLCFAGHTDVVPPGDLAQWTSDPFTPMVRGGRLYGRGAADMKAGLACMVVAVEQFLQDHLTHRGSIAFLITSDEEGKARDGTLRVVETLQDRNELIDWCVIGEPSSQQRFGDVVRVGRRGSLSGLLTVFGTQGHVAYPQLADNPISRFAPALAELVSTAWDQGNAFCPATSFQVVDLQSGVGAPNVTPAELSARFNFRYSNEWHHEELQQRTQSILDRHGLDYKLDWHLSGEPFLTEPGRLTEALVSAVRDVTGVDTEMSTGGGTSDGRFIAPAGADVVEIGPVNASIHKIDEHVLLEDVGKLTLVYRRLLELLLLD